MGELYTPPGSYVSRIVFCPVWEGSDGGGGDEGGGEVVTRQPRPT